MGKVMGNKNSWAEVGKDGRVLWGKEWCEVWKERKRDVYSSKCMEEGFKGRQDCWISLGRLSS